MITNPDNDRRILDLSVGADASSSEIRQLTPDELLALVRMFADRDLTPLTSIDSRAYVPARYHAQLLDVLTEIARRFEHAQRLVMELTLELDNVDQMFGVRVLDRVS